MRGETFVPVPNRGMLTISIMMANIMQGVDNSILNVALPHVQGSSLSASLDQIAWALLLYRLRRDHDAADRLARRPLRHQIYLSDLQSSNSTPSRSSSSAGSIGTVACSNPT